MELNEIKDRWSDLNSRLERTEVLNKRVILELLNTRQQSAKDKLIRYEVVFLILCIVFTGFTIATSFAGFYAPSTIIILSTIFVLCGLWQIYKIILLNRMHIDTCSTNQLLHKAIRFKVITRMRTVVGLILIVPLFVAMVMLDKNLNNTAAITGVIVGGSVGLGIGLSLFFKNLKDIDSLVKGYKDLNEFDNE